MPSEEPRIQISIGSRLEHIDLIQTVVDDALAQAGLRYDSRYRVGVAVREAVTNAITHGNEEDPEKLVEVELAITDSEAVIRVDDRGEGFDVRSVRDPLTPSQQLEPHGRGIFLMRSFMDEIGYTFPIGGGTSVTLRKQLTEPRTLTAAEAATGGLGQPTPGSANSEGGDVKIESRDERGVTVLEPRGNITIGVGDVALRAAVSSALEAGARNLIVDLGLVTGMDSSGLGELMTSYTTVSKRGGKLKLANLPPKVTDILHVTQLISVFEVHPNIDEALASFD